MMKVYRATQTILCIWVTLNIALLPLAFAQSDIEQVITIHEEAQSILGAWGKITPLRTHILPALDSSPQSGIQEVTSRTSPLNIAALACLLLLASFFSRRLERKAQITLFILLGLVTLIIFLFLFYISGIDATSSSSLKESTTSAIETSAIKYYVYSCLDHATIEGITLLGNQGGFIHRHQNGSIIDWDIPYLAYADGLGNEYNVTYQIYNPLTGALEPIDPFLRDDPAGSPHNYYPCRQGNPNPALDPIQGDYCLENYDHALSSFGSIGRLIKFGVTGIGSLANNRVIPDLCTRSVSLGIYSCVCPPSHKCEYSLQAQLESYIANRSIDCMNFTHFPGYNVTYGEPIVNVTMSADDVSVLLTLPMTIRRKNGLPESKVSEFHSFYPVRLKLIHALLFGGNLMLPGGSAINTLPGIINQELNVTHDIILDGQDTLNRIGGMTIRKILPDGLTNTTIIVINDSLSNIGGYPFIFQFAIENRKPALDWIEETGYTWNGVDYQVYLHEGDTLLLSPLAYDPDEDLLTYAYSGWKADWDDHFDDSAATIESMFSSTPLTTNYWHLSPPYQAGCIHPRYGNTHHRCANISTARSDVGPHNITVTVTDSEGHADWQLVRILVDDEPQLPPTSLNEYPDIPDDRASIEDRFLIDVSATLDIIGNGPLKYSWNDIFFPHSIHPDFRVFDEENTIHHFPFEGPLFWDIVRIHSQDHAFNDTGMHEIVVKARRDTGPIGTRTFLINVTECLPHRSTSNPAPYGGDVPPYPFNEPLTGIMNSIPYSYHPDPFQANHTCCADDYIYSADTQDCFRLVDYGPYDVRNTHIASLTEGNKQPPGSILPTLSAPPPNGQADYSQVFRRAYTVRCTGTAGNTCIPSGWNEEHTITYHGACTSGHPYCTYAAYGTAPHCVSVSPSSAWNPSTRRIESDGICDTTPVCSTNGNRQLIASDASGNCAGLCNLCERTCGNSGNCNFGMNCISCPWGCGDDPSNPGSKICIP